MADVRAMRIPGRWRAGFVLDYHTLSSTYLGDDQFGHPQFETKRTSLGELLYRLKYHGDESTLPELVDAAATFVESWKPGVHLVIPVPPSQPRNVQPVFQLGDGLAERLGIPFDPNCLTKVREAPELKNVYDYDEVYAFSMARTPWTGQG